MTKTVMEQEALSAPQLIAKQWQANQSIIKALAKKLQQHPPQFAATVARGSSDHAATFAQYLLSTQLGLVTASLAPSTVTLYNSQLQTKNSLVIGISQSGKSPDICETLQAAKKNHAITVAIVNVTDSPLAEIADYVIPLHVGEEKAVAATKSYLGSLAALIQLTAELNQDKVLLNAMQRLPDNLAQAAQQDWSAAIEALVSADDALVLARGYGFPIAQEAALKLKETCSMHAEAFSGAEVLHGPFAVIKPNFPVLMFTQQDATLRGMQQVAEKIKAVGAKLLIAEPSSTTLPLPSSLHPICDPLLCIQAFYPMAAKLAVKRGKNPDAPENLQKVTETR